MNTKETVQATVNNDTYCQYVETRVSMETQWKFLALTIQQKNSVFK